MIVVYDELYTQHLARVDHPESPERVAAVAAHLEAEGLFDRREPARDASDGELEFVHPRAYVERVKRDVADLANAAATGGERAGYLSTGDTVIDATSFEVARRAAGGAIRGMERAVETEGPVFALVRPPGHHAEPARGMGFCVFSNAAIAAHAFVRATGGSALIVDFDYHHGNGTQRAARDGVSFVSTHAYPAYPGTGGPTEQALRDDAAIVNVPLPPHDYGTEPFVATWQRILPEVARRVRPDLLVVSAGYDIARGDPVGDLDVDAPVAGYALAVTIAEIAHEYARGRVVYCLEGGYDVATLGRAVAATIRGGDAPPGRGDVADRTSIPPPQRAHLRALEEAWPQ